MLDWEEQLVYIMKETRLPRKIVEEVLDAETRYLMKTGIAEGENHA